MSQIALEKRLNEIRRLEGINRDLLAALKDLVDDLWFRLEAANENCLIDDPPSWHSWLFSMMSTHGDIAEAAIAKAEEGLGCPTP